MNLYNLRCLCSILKRQTAERYEFNIKLTTPGCLPLGVYHKIIEPALPYVYVHSRRDIFYAYAWIEG